MFKIELPKKDCMVCGKCWIVCNQNAISFKLTEWNYEPVIDKSKCIRCGRCVNVCNNKIALDEYFDSKSFGVTLKNKNLSIGSSSSGIFYVVAKKIIEMGGVVFGAVFDRDSVVHKSAHNLHELEKIRKSKYVQSNWVTILPEMNDALKSEKMVLFSGTPCQVATVKDSFGKYNNLYTIDLYCHGVAVAGLFKNYLQTYKKKIANVEFRTKDYTSKSAEDELFFKFFFDDGSITFIPLSKDIFYRLFSTSESLKDACFDCYFADKKHKSDITLGDLDLSIASNYGINDNYPSLTTVNTKKGFELLELVSNQLQKKAIAPSDLGKYYRQHNYTGVWGYNRDKQRTFFENNNKFGFEKAANLSMKDAYGFFGYYKIKIKKLLKYNEQHKVG